MSGGGEEFLRRDFIVLGFAVPDSALATAGTHINES
jgi:hypothetical protein